jgi:hypothetical protein
MVLNVKTLERLIVTNINIDPLQDYRIRDIE